MTSILRQLVVFTGAVVVAAMSLSFAVTLLMPPPEPGQMSIDEMVYALNGGRSKVIDIAVTSDPPDGLRTRLIERSLAQILRRPVADIRAVWRGQPTSNTGRGQAIVLIDRRDVLVESAKNGFTIRYGPSAELRSSTLLPLFTAALRSPNGRWRTGIPRDPQVEQWRLRILLAYALGLIVLTPLAWIVARRVAAPVIRLGEVARAAAPTAFEPFPVAGPRELRDTAQAMNAMHRRLRNHADQQTRIFAALAHDLRTPLTALRLRAEALDEPMRARFVDDLDRMTQMASQLLEQAETGAALPQMRRIELYASVASWCADLRDAGQPMRFEHGEPLWVETDPILLRRAVENLADNAVRYGGDAIVTVIRDAGTVSITIDDRGPGIAEDKLAAVLEPFVRLDPSRTRSSRLGGTGLGLSIADDIARRLGGTLTLANLPIGLRAQISLPIEQSVG